MEWDRRPLRGPEGGWGGCLQCNLSSAPRRATSLITTLQSSTDRSETPLIPWPSRKYFSHQSSDCTGIWTVAVFLFSYLFIFDHTSEPGLDWVDTIYPGVTTDNLTMKIQKEKKVDCFSSLYPLSPVSHTQLRLSGEQINQLKWRKQATTTKTFLCQWRKR